MCIIQTYTNFDFTKGKLKGDLEIFHKADFCFTNKLKTDNYK